MSVTSDTSGSLGTSSLSTFPVWSDWGQEPNSHLPSRAELHHSTGCCSQDPADPAGAGEDAAQASAAASALEMALPGGMNPHSEEGPQEDPVPPLRL